MRIAVIGTPGSGKTWIARFISDVLKLKHIETDKIFWREGKEISLDLLRKEIDQLTLEGDWIIDGHMGKLSDIVLSRIDKIVIVEHSDWLSFLRTLKRDGKKIISGPHRLSSLKKIAFNFQNYEKNVSRRNDFIEKLSVERAEDLLFWSNDSDSTSMLIANLTK